MKSSTWSLATALFLTVVTVFLAFQLTPAWWSIVTLALMTVATVLAFWRYALERRDEQRRPVEETDESS